MKNVNKIVFTNNNLRVIKDALDYYIENKTIEIENGWIDKEQTIKQVNRNMNVCNNLLSKIHHCNLIRGK